MLNEVFSDHFAHKDNFLTRIDARIKMVFVFGAIITVLFSARPCLGAITAFLILSLLTMIKIPLKIIFFRAVGPISMAVAVLFLQIFFVHGIPLSKGLLIIGKVAGCVSLIIFLSMTTPVNALLAGASWLRLPKTWVEVAVITYRYVFVLAEDAIIIKDAQKVRLGYSNLQRSARSLSELIGSIFIRAYDQSISTHEAMQLRGYSGNARYFLKDAFRPKDGLHFVIFSIILFLLVILNFIWR